MSLQLWACAARCTSVKSLGAKYLLFYSIQSIYITQDISLKNAYNNSWCNFNGGSGAHLFTIWYAPSKLKNNMERYLET